MGQAQLLRAVQGGTFENSPLALQRPAFSRGICIHPQATPRDWPGHVFAHVSQGPHCAPLGDGPQFPSAPGGRMGYPGRTGAGKGNAAALVWLEIAVDEISNSW